jgi:hypothetical protein
MRDALAAKQHCYPERNLSHANLITHGAEELNSGFRKKLSFPLTLARRLLKFRTGIMPSTTRHI